MQTRISPLYAWANWRTALVLLLAVAAFTNAAAYISYAGIPFVTSDGWYFVDVFLQKHFQSGLTLQDFYVKRGPDDHAQPLQKLLLLWNAESFDLDFVIESYMGLAIAAIAWLLMLHVMAVDNYRRATPFWWMLPAVASAACFVSLSGGMVFNWSLVTLGYLGPLAAVVLAITAWNAVVEKQWWPLVLAALVVQFTLDGTALICALSLICALALREFRSRCQSLSSTLAASAIVAGALIAYKLASHLYLHSALPSAPAGEAGIASVLHLGGASLGKMLLTMAALSVADLAPLQFHFPARGQFLHHVLGGLVIAAHGWFWWRALRDTWNRTQFLSVVLMLFCYGAAAGIVVSRVSVFGPDYVSQQRYLMLYQIGTVALALMASGSDWRIWRPLQRAMVLAGLLMLILAQVPLSKATWREAPFVQAYGNNLGRQMILLGADPSAKLASCAPTLVVCAADSNERRRSITLLRDHHLNAYSPRMLDRYSMQTIGAPTGAREIVSPAPAK